MMISLVSAITIIAGNSYSFESEEFEYYTMVGNSSNADGMNISWEGGITTINFDLLFKPDTFTLVFFNEKEVIVEVNVGGGGGGSRRTIYKDNNITKYVDREVEKIVEVENQEEIDRLLNITNKAVKRENIFKILFAFSFAILLLMIAVKIKNNKEQEKKIKK